MYLSDLFVSAHKNGGKEYIDMLFVILENMPGEFWEELGGYQWLRCVRYRYLNDKDRFYADLESYAESDNWKQGLKTLGDHLEEQDNASL